MSERVYIAIDLKSFYASAECAALSLDPLNTNLVVADESRTEKTICLAVSPSLKAYGISGRARLFEVIEKVKQINAARLTKAPGRRFKRKTCFASELAKDASLELDFIIAPPKMASYLQISAQIYNIYLRYIAPEDIHVYSIDEVFIDASSYLKVYKLTPREFAMFLIRNILRATGITATAGIGTNLYLAKVAMDIVAKHMNADKNGARIAELNELSYRQKLWTHQPLTDFWRVGSGISRKLIANGLYTMGDVARCSLGKVTDFYNEDLLYKLFGINAELLIDHAWGYEPCTIAEIKSYIPRDKSIGSGQVLHRPYGTESARLVLKEMAIQLSEDLIEKKTLARQIILSIGYDAGNIINRSRLEKYTGEIILDHYGRPVPKPSHGSINLKFPTSLPSLISKAATELYDKIANKDLLIRRLNITAANLMPENVCLDEVGTQLSFLDADSYIASSANILSRGEKHNLKTTWLDEKSSREKHAERALIEIRKKYGKNAMIKGLNLLEGATGTKRNRQIGGHSA